MTISGFKTAQKTRNLNKKENNNKDYRGEEKKYVTNKFSSGEISIDYILRTKYGICLNETNKKFMIPFLYDRFQNKNPPLICFKEHSDDENQIIQQEVTNYYNLGLSQRTASYDKTHSSHSKNLTKNRNMDRQRKWDNNS